MSLTKYRRAVRFTLFAWLSATVFMFPPYVLSQPDHPVARGDLDRGQALYSRCMGCHSLERNRTGPKHCGLFGRKAGAVDGYLYSDAMKQADIVWNAATLDAFLQAPMDYIPGTYMGYAGVKDAQARWDLIAWLRQASESAKCH